MGMPCADGMAGADVALLLMAELARDRESRTRRPRCSEREAVGPTDGRPPRWLCQCLVVVFDWSGGCRLSSSLEGDPSTRRSAATRLRQRWGGPVR